MIEQEIDKILSAWRDPVEEQKPQPIVTEKWETHLCHTPIVHRVDKGYVYPLHYIECKDCGLKTAYHIQATASVEEWDKLVKNTIVLKKIIFTPDGEKIEYIKVKRGDKNEFR